MFRSIVKLIRPNVLLLGLSVMMPAQVIAYQQGQWDALIALLMLLTTVSLQVLSNIANDYGDGLRGVDRFRVGPSRVVAEGALSSRFVLNALYVNIVLSVILGVWLLCLTVQSQSDAFMFVLLGLVAILAALGYTLGRYAYGYYALGDISVFIFFGLLAVMGSSYLYLRVLYMPMWLIAVGCGLFSVAVLQVNNMRDIQSDRLSGKHTLATCVGLKTSRYIYLVVTSLGLLTYLLFSFVTSYTGGLLCLLVAPFLYVHWQHLFQGQGGASLQRCLPEAVLLCFLVNIFWGFGVIVLSV